MVQFLHGPSWIHGFFQMRWIRVPTKKIKDVGKSVEEIYQNNLVYDTIYSVVHASNKNMSYNDLKTSMIDWFIVGGDEMHHCVSDGKVIAGPLITVKDIDAFFVVCPYCDWDNFLVFIDKYNLSWNSK